MSEETPNLFSDDDSEVLATIEVPFVRSPYNYNRDLASIESGLKCEDRSLAVQEGREEADINTIVKRFGLTGQFPVGLISPVYGDFSGLNSYHEAANAIAQANETFDELPAEIRNRFMNDPGQFVDFAVNPENRAELEKWGMVVRAPTVASGSSDEPVVPAVEPAT